MIELQGDYLEGGGSIVRLAVALSAITKKPIKITNIRQGRKKPGLKTQHLRAIETVANLCNAELRGAELGSTKIEFYPKEIQAKKLNVNIETSGSVGLLLQCVMIPCFFSNAPIEIEIKGGGTFGLYSPNILYTKEVLLPTIKKLGFDAEIEIKKHGFFPKGGSDIICRIKPFEKGNLLILKERGNLKEINGISIASAHLKKANVAERQSDAAKKLLAKEDFNDVKIKNEYAESLCPGSAILLYANFENSILAYDALGELGKKAEKVGEEAAAGLLKQLKTNAALDEFMSDQILIYLALAKQHSIIKISELTSHAKTNIWLIKKFLDVDFKIEDTTIEIIPGT